MGVLGLLPSSSSASNAEGFADFKAAEHVLPLFVFLAFFDGRTSVFALALRLQVAHCRKLAALKLHSPLSSPPTQYNRLNNLTSS